MTSPARTGSARRGRRGGAQAVVGVLGFLAVAGSAVLFLTDDPRWLRLGLVTLMWVAVAALIAVVRYRKDSETAAARSADLRVVYELELEREVAARRTHEVAVEREVTARVTEEVRNEARVDLDELRDELKALRENLSLLLSGDLMVERVALRAESTRLRSLTDTARIQSGAAASLERGTDPDEDAVDAETVEPATGGSGDAREPQTVGFEVLEPEPEPEPEPDPEPQPYPEPVRAEHDGPVTEVIPVVPAEGLDDEAPAVAPVVDREPPVVGEPAMVAVAPALTAPETATPETATPEPATDETTAPEPATDEPATPEPVPPVDPGAHSAGRSVSELLAAYGGAGAAPRRRRRAED